MASKSKGSIRLVGTTITIDNMSIDTYVNKNKAALLKASKGSAQARNLVLSYFSDFISREGPFKHPPKEAFSNPKAAPDIAGSVQDFEKHFGFTPVETSISGASGAFVELKQRTAVNRDVTITSTALTGTNLKDFTKSQELTKSTKDDGSATFKGQKINEISSDTLVAFIKANPALRKNVETQIVQKFENFVVIDFLDKARKGAPIVKALGNSSAILFKGTDILSSKNLSVIARQTKSSDKSKVGITLQYKLSKSGYELFLKRATDTTIQFHKTLANNVSQRFLKEALQRFVQGKANQNTFNFIAAAVGMATEFEKRPVVYQTNVAKPKQGLSSTNVSTKVPIRAISNQKFISSIQLTALVQKRLEATMGKGTPNPPWLKERSGRFRKSVAVYPNYRNNLIRYTYMPLYDANLKYGYKVEEQVGNSIRDVVQALYTRKFNIVRG